MKIEVTKLQTERLYIRKLNMEDFNDVYAMLSDKEVMHFWGHTFTEELAREWIQKNLNRYDKDGYSYMYVENEDHNFIGVIGLLNESIDDKNHLGIGYILKKEYWHRGYATEGAKACLHYAFEVMKADQVILDIHYLNLNSIKVAERLGFQKTGEHNKFYQNQNLLHLIYTKKRPE